jgi:hypothetical protein
VCDYDLPSVGDPSATVAAAPAVRVAGHVVIARAEPGAIVELRSGGVVVDEAVANRGGIAVMTMVPAGTYVVRQVTDGGPGLRTAPITVH